MGEWRNRKIILRSPHLQISKSIVYQINNLTIQQFNHQSDETLAERHTGTGRN
jgi:hypothetical protein